MREGCVCVRAFRSSLLVDPWGGCGEGVRRVVLTETNVWYQGRGWLV